MQKKSFSTLLYSSAGIIVMLAIVIAVNVLTGVRPVRVDLTKEKAYTLSDGTRAVLQKLDTPIKIRFYCTQAENATPDTVALKAYARTVEDLLQEYQQVAGKNFVIEKYDPQPDSDAEDSARLDGLEPQTLTGDDQFYLGLSVNLADQHVAIPFLDPGRDRQLEYDLTRAITRVFTPDKPIVAVMSSLPVFGQPPNPMMEESGQTGPPPWTLISQLQDDFSLRHLDLTADKIDDDVKVLLLIHPKDISEQTQYAIDQFILRGGKVIALLDAESILDVRQQQQQQQQNPMGGGPGNASSTLDKLLPAWGLAFDSSKVVADLNFKLELNGPNGQPTEAPAFLGLNSDGINRDDIATSPLDSVWLPLCGAFTGSPVAGLQETVLLHSSTQAELVDGTAASMDDGSLLNDFKTTGVSYALAVRLTGKFPTAFPNGRPGDDNATTNAPAPAGLKVSQVDSSVVLIGDSDFAADNFSISKSDSPFGAMATPLNANLNLLLNLVEQLTGDNSLIAIRSRATTHHPFTRIESMEASAEAQGEAKITELQNSLNDTQQRLDELQAQKKDQSQQLILSSEQRTELDNFRKKQAEVDRELIQARKDLRKEVVSLETRIKWLNIFAVPLAVTLVGVLVAFVKRKKNSAQ
jgi:ABC-type uncharacterized transport system involved in gliding motility auxiliary subunit